MIEVTETKYFENYQRIMGHRIDEWIQRHDFSDQKIEFGYSTKSSAVYSSNIEGNPVDLNLYMNQKLANHKAKPTKEVAEIDNLATAYEFAQNNQLDEKNFLKCHAIFSKTLLIKSKRGKYRAEKVGVFSESGLVYLAIEPEYVEKHFFRELKRC